MDILRKSFFGSGASGCVSPNLPSFFSKVIDMLQECVFKSGKVFDKVTIRKQLIEKLKHMRGPKGRLLEWVRHFMTRHQIKIVIKDGIEVEWSAGDPHCMKFYAAKINCNEHNIFLHFGYITNAKICTRQDFFHGQFQRTYSQSADSYQPHTSPSLHHSAINGENAYRSLPPCYPEQYIPRHHACKIYFLA